MRKQYFLWALKNPWKLSGIAVAILTLPLTIILCLFGVVEWGVIFIPIIMSIIPIIPIPEYGVLRDVFGKYLVWVLFFLPIVVLIFSTKGLFERSVIMCLFVWLVFLAI